LETARTQLHRLETVPHSATYKQGKRLRSADRSSAKDRLPSHATIRREKKTHNLLGPTHVPSHVILFSIRLTSSLSSTHLVDACLGPAPHQPPSTQMELRRPCSRPSGPALILRPDQATAPLLWAPHVALCLLPDRAPAPLPWPPTRAI
jgi:hypothetical protein